MRCRYRCLMAAAGVKYNQYKIMCKSFFNKIGYINFGHAQYIVYQVFRRVDRKRSENLEQFSGFLNHVSAVHLK